MSDLDAITAHRQALERTIAVRKARLKTRRQTLFSEMQARLTPKGIMSEFPLTTLLIAVGIGWFAGRTFRILLTPQSRLSFRSTSSAQQNIRSTTPLKQMLKEIMLQTISQVALNKAREFLVGYLSGLRRKRAKNDFVNTP